jgi:hypothetical protein
MNCNTTTPTKNTHDTSNTSSSYTTTGESSRANSGSTSSSSPFGLSYVSKTSLRASSFNAYDLLNRKTYEKNVQEQQQQRQQASDHYKNNQSSIIINKEKDDTTMRGQQQPQIEQYQHRHHHQKDTRTVALPPANVQEEMKATNTPARTSRIASTSTASIATTDNTAGINKNNIKNNTEEEAGENAGEEEDTALAPKKKQQAYIHRLAQNRLTYRLRRDRNNMYLQSLQSKKNERRIRNQHLQDENKALKRQYLILKLIIQQNTNMHNHNQHGGATGARPLSHSQQPSFTTQPRTLLPTGPTQQQPNTMVLAPQPPILQGGQQQQTFQMQQQLRILSLQHRHQQEQLLLLQYQEQQTLLLKRQKEQQAVAQEQQQRQHQRQEQSSNGMKGNLGLSVSPPLPRPQSQQPPASLGHAEM